MSVNSKWQLTLVTALQDEKRCDLLGLRRNAAVVWMTSISVWLWNFKDDGSGYFLGSRKSPQMAAMLHHICVKVKNCNRLWISIISCQISIQVAYLT